MEDKTGAIIAIFATFIIIFAFVFKFSKSKFEFGGIGTPIAIALILVILSVLVYFSSEKLRGQLGKLGIKEKKEKSANNIIVFGVAIACISFLILFTPIVSAVMDLRSIDESLDSVTLQEGYKLCNIEVISQLGKVMSPDYRNVCNFVNFTTYACYIGLGLGLIFIVIGVAKK